MRTGDDLWGWVEEDGWLDEDPAEASGPLTDDVQELLRAPHGSAEPLIVLPPSGGDDRVSVVVEAVPAPAGPSPPPSVAPPQPRPEPPVPPGGEAAPPSRLRRTERRRLRRRLRRVLIVAAAGAAAIVPFVAPGNRPPPRDPANGGATAPATQEVVAWTVWDERPSGAAFVAVLGAGGARPPVVVAMPGNTAVSIPGHGLGTIDDAAAARDVTTVAATVENVLGVRVDDAWGIPLTELRTMVDELGGIDVEGRPLPGTEVAAYLREPPSDAAAERLIRWQAVLDGLLTSSGPGNVEALAVPPELHPVFAVPEVDSMALPVEDLGAGLARPDQEAVAELVAERFVPTSGEDKIRLVVLNGNGTPGLGETVARLLVPEGYRLVASQNASEFGIKVTKIIASDREDLPAARKARRLLGVGRVLLGQQPTGLADVTVVVGLDFGGP